MDEEKKVNAAGGLDSSFDSEELDEELKDKVNDAKSFNSDDSGNSSDGALLHNTDLTYFDVMNPDEKICTLNNRMIKLKERTLLMMQDIDESEALYPAGQGWQDIVGTSKQMYPSDDNYSNLSGYQSSGGGLDMQFHSSQLMQGIEELKQGLEECKAASTADDTESAAQMTSSVMQGETSSQTSQASRSSPQRLAKYKASKPVPAAHGANKRR